MARPESPHHGATAFADGRGTARYFQALREHWPFIALTVLFAVTAAVLYTTLAGDRYRAQADILVTPVSGADETFDGIPVLRETTEARNVVTVARLLRSPQVADAVLRDVGLPGGRDDLLADVEIRPQAQSNIVTVSAEADSPAEAVRIANAFADTLLTRLTVRFQRSLRSVVQRLDRRLEFLESDRSDSAEAAALSERLGDLRGLVGGADPTLQVVSRAVAPSEASWPRPALSIAVALLAGIVLGMGVAVGLELLNPLVLREEELPLDHGLPVLARVPRTGQRAVAELVQQGRVPVEVADAYRMLRARLETAGGGRLPHSLAVTSAGRPNERAVVAAELAATVALAGYRVVLADADLRQSRVAALLGVTPSQPSGLELVLRGEEARAGLVDATTPGLELLMGGTGDAGLVDLVEPGRVARLLDELNDVADVVVFDTPSPAEVADGLTLAAAVDTVLLVVRIGKTRRDALAQLSRTLAHQGIVPAGVIALTRSRARGPSERLVVVDREPASARSR